MCELPQGAAEGVVFFVVKRMLEVVASADGGFAVSGVGFVGVQIDFAEESGRERFFLRVRKKITFIISCSASFGLLNGVYSGILSGGEFCCKTRIKWNICRYILLFMMLEFSNHID